MQTNDDFRDLFAELNAAVAEYIITSIDGVEFDSAWPERMPSEYGDQRVHVLSRRHLIENKKASGRLQDLADVEFLEKGDRS